MNYSKNFLATFVLRVFILMGVVFAFSIFATQNAQAQCGPTTPSFTVDLSGNPDSSWVSTWVVRQDTCCGSTGNCVEFLLTLDSAAQGIIFDVCDGALPSGALFYQVDCGPQTAVGNVLCLSGAGPHKITFCKPGNNSNLYCIQSISEPDAGPDIAVSDGCIDTLTANGYEDTSITWTSIFPGARGAYDTSLSCKFGCPTTIVTGGSGYPPYIDFEVCGIPLGGCDSVYVCDTARVSFFSTLNVDILPKNPTVCFGQSNTWISANPSGGSPPYSITWSTNETTDSIQVGAGTYYVTLSDNTGCPPTFDTVTVTEFLNPITANAGQDQVVCLQNIPIQLNGSVTAASGGIWSGGNGTFAPSDTSLTTSYTPTQTEINSGSIQLYLTTTGNGTCPPATDTINIQFASFNATLSLSTTNVSCFGGNDGESTVSVTNGSPPFTYLWDVNAGNQATATADSLSVGSYTVTVTDDNGCTDTITATITEPQAIVASITASTDVSCFGGNNGSATASASGGTTPYTYNWPSSGSNATENNLAQGSYIVTVSDANGCSDTSLVVINEPQDLIASISSSTDVSCFGGNDGSATASVMGGTTPYTYSWPSSGSDATENNLTQGSYIVTVSDSNGCSDTALVVINEPQDLIASISSSTDVSCFGGNDGSATASATGGTTPYTYSWPSSGSNATENNLTQGSYIVTVSDSNGCSDTALVVINEPQDLIASISSFSNVSCFGGSDGSATATASGGTTPYTYSWPSSGSNATENNLAQGSYIVTVTDSNGCSDTALVVINEPQDLIASISSSTDVSCFGGNDGSATASASGGTTPYTYSWPSSGSNATENNLAQGSYIVTVSDANGCSDTALVVINEPQELIASISNSTDVSCFGGNDGSATTSASGGTTPYTYSWPSSGSNATENNLTQGSYIVTVSDANGCSDTALVVINEPQDLIASISSFSNVSCFGGNDGSATATASGGTTPYTYSWPSSGSNATENNLAQGSYTVTVSDANGCSDTVTVQISEPSVLNANINLSTDVSCFGGSDGFAIASANGGTAPYTFLWPSNNTSATENNLSEGTYTVTITDANGCESNATAIINEPNPLTLTAVIRPVSCFDGSDGSISVIINGGTRPYNYNWSNNTSDSTTSSLREGNYGLTVTDNNGCEIDTIFNVQEPGPITLTASANDTICAGSNYTISASASGGNGNYTYSWSNGLGNGQSKNININETTTFYVEVSDSKGCRGNRDSVKVYVRNLNSDLLTVSKSGDICKGESATITATHDGDLGPYTYSWNRGGTDLSPFQVSPQRTQTYILTVVDRCGAVRSDSVTVIVHDYPSINLPQQIASGCSPVHVTFIDSLNTNNNYTYLWEFGDGNSSSNRSATHTYHTAGTYTVKLSITSEHGCKSESSANSGQVIVRPSPKANFSATPPEADIDNPVIQFQNTSIGANQFHWRFGVPSNDTLSNSPTVTYPDTGTYAVKLFVVNNFGCTDSITKEVRIKPVFDVVIPNAFTPNPNGPSDGSYNLGDLDNDIFYIFAEYVQEFHMMIFNRWGELIFESFDINKGWDGYYRDALCQQDVYVYKVEIKWTDGTVSTKAGDVTLFR